MTKNERIKALEEKVDQLEKRLAILYQQFLPPPYVSTCPACGMGGDFACMSAACPKRTYITCGAQ